MHRAIGEGVLIAGGYLLLGRLALLLALPPGYATAVWPAAGLALAVVLLKGAKAVPAVIIGSGLTNLWTDVATGGMSWPGGLAAALIGCGAGAQSWAGAWLVRRFAGWPNSLLSEREVLRFLVFGGPLGCLVGATAGVLTLHSLGILPDRDLGFSWFTWWTGDTLGVVLCAPLLLLRLSAGMERDRRREWAVTLPMLGAGLVLTAVYLRASVLEAEQARSEFGRRGDAVRRVLAAGIDRHLELVWFMQLGMSLGTELNRGSFLSLASEAVRRNPGIYALEWAPLVRSEERARFEMELSSEWSEERTVRERDAAGNIVVAGAREHFVPVQFAVPEEPNRRAIGFDLLSEPMRRATIRRAWASGQMAATPPIRLVQESEDQAGFLVVEPVFPMIAGGAASEPRGFWVGVFRAGDLLRACVAPIDTAGLELRLMYLPTDGRPIVLSGPGAGLEIPEPRPIAAAPGRMLESADLDVAGARWRIEITPTAEYLRAHRSLQSWALLASGLMFVGLLGAFLLLMTGRSRRIEALVELRSAELQASHDRFSLAVAGSREGIWDWDLARGTSDYSPRFRELLGTGEAGPSSFRLALEQCAHPEDRGRALADLDRHLQNRTPFGAEYRLRAADGTYRWFMVSGQAKWNSAGAPVRMAGSLADTTDRRHAEEALRRSVHEIEDLRFALDQAAIVAITDARGTIRSVNDRFCEISGYSREELLGQDHRIVNSGTHPKEFIAGLWNTIRGGRVWKGEICNRTKCGRLYWVDTTITPFLDAQGVPVRYIAIRHDITSRKQAELGLQALGAELRAVLDHATSVAVISFDPVGRIRVFNTGACRMLGYTSEEAVGLSSVLALHDPGEIEARARRSPAPPGVSPSALDAFTEPARRAQVDSGEWTYVRKDGSRLPVHLTLTVLRGQHGAATGYLAIASDLSERKRVEGELAQARDAALALAQAKSDFVANMSHEIRTPMNAVIGMSGLLADTPLSPQQQQFVDSIRSAGNALLSLINDVLDYSGLEAGSLRLEDVEFDLEEALEESAHWFVARARDKGLELGVYLADDLPTAVRGDPGRIRQVVGNLLSNALKFTERGSVVLRATRVSEAPTHVRIRVEVEDTGIGIPAEIQAAVFEPFRQADTSSTRSFGGMGLGLTISQRIMEALGGRIGVESRPGGGSRFWFEWTPEKARREAPERSRVDLSGKRVLVLDDHSINREILVHQLSARGMECETVETAAAAVERATAARELGRPFAAVLLDMQIPGGTGMSAAGDLRRRLGNATPPLLLLSSAPVTAGPEELRAAGIVAVLLKPVRRSRLFETLEKVLAIGSAPVRPVSSEAVTASPPGIWGNLRILAVEDTPINQRVLLLQLERLGYRADAVGNGREAIAAVVQAPYDLILMDCQMPEMDGFEATREIRRREAGGRRVPIVAMTANAMAGDREACLAAGMDDFLAKPVRPADLEAAIARWHPPLDPARLPRDAAGTGGAFPDLARVALAEIERAIEDGLWPALAAQAESLAPVADAAGARGILQIARRLLEAARGKNRDAALRLARLLAEELERVRAAWPA